MRVLLFVLFALCFVPEQIFGGKILKYGLSSWCDADVKGYVYPLAPARCCKLVYGCDVFVKPGKTAYGITNTGEWNLRRCACDVFFHGCIKAKMSRPDAFKATLLLKRHACIAPKKCPKGQICTTTEYEVVVYRDLVSQLNAETQAEKSMEKPDDKAISII